VFYVFGRLIARAYWDWVKGRSDDLRRELDRLAEVRLAYRRNPYHGLIAYQRARARRAQAELDELYRRAEARPRWPISRRSPRRKPTEPTTRGPGSAAPP